MSTKLGNLGIELLGLAAAVQKLVEDGTTFAAVRPGPGLLPPQTLAGTDAVPVRNGRFTLGGSATAQLQISAVKDPGSNQDDAQILQSAPSCAWLKHELDARIDGTLGGPLGSGGAAFGLEGELGASLVQYRAHALTDPVGRAVIDDVLGFRLALRLDDVRGLRGGDVLACTVHGKLGLSAHLTLADTLSAAMVSLDERLGPAGVSVVALREGLSVRADLSIEDDYRLVFRAGSQNGATRVELRKARGRKAGGSVALSLRAALELQPLRQAVDAYLQSRLGQTLSQVELLSRQVSSVAACEFLPPDERVLAEQIAARLGLTDLRRQWRDLAARLDGLIDQLTTKLSDAVRLKGEAEAPLAYTRIQTEETILACELDGAALARHHSDLLLGDFTRLLDGLAAGAGGYRLIEDLKQTRIHKEISFGLSLSIGPWAASGLDKVVKDWKEQVDREGRERSSFTGQQTYTGTWGGATTQYACGLGAAMEGFSAVPQDGELKYSLSFGWSWSETLTPSLLADALDLAGVWGISDQAANEAHQRSILGQASGKVRIELEVQVSDAGVRALLDVPADQFEGAWIAAMAPALSRVRIPPQTYATRLGDRVQIYGEAARLAFSARGGTEIAAIAGRVRYPANVEDRLAEVERGQTDIGLNVLCTATTIDARPAGRCRRARAALDRLADAIRRHHEKE